MENDFLKLLLKYSELPKSKRHIGIFEVSGYPHYENVSSNVLAFYLQPKNEHGLSYLLLTSLLKLAGQAIEGGFGEANVHQVYREYPSIDGGRLDLLIRSDTHVIGIENKIFHYVANDLDDYKNTIDQLAGNHLIPIRIVLSLNPEKLVEKRGFVSITYRDLWREVRANLGFYVKSSSQKWTSYLLDFMHTTESFTGETMALSSTDHFFIENDEMIQKMMDDRRELIDRLNKEIPEIQKIVEKTEGVKDLSRTCWIYKESCLVNDFILPGKLAGSDADLLLQNLVGFDLEVSPKGWVLKVFGRNIPSHQYVTKLVAERRDQLTIEANRFVIKRWALNTSLDEISKVLCEWMKWIVEVHSDRKKV